MNLSRYRLRPMTSADAGLMSELFLSSPTGIGMAQLGLPVDQLQAMATMQVDARISDYRRLHPDARFDVVEVGAEAVGRLFSHRNSDRVAVLDIALLPSAQSSGLGSQILTDLHDDARKRGIPVTGSVLADNVRARLLYERLGCVISEVEGSLHWGWRWPAHGTSA